DGAIYAELKRHEIIKSSNGVTQFVSDYTIKSPSRAAGLLTGLAVSGRKAWKNEVGISLKDILG
ncbi:MAG: hypothetical protein DRI98_14785, partial [Bacteroidetes bacterium]